MAAQHVEVSATADAGGKIAVVIPCYKVTDSIESVIEQIGDEVAMIIAVDDKCPDNSGKFIAENVTDPRVTVRFHEQNKGVGGAVMTGYKFALESGADIVVKVDGDGQMDPALLPQFVAPIQRGEADYTKGNRFYSVYNIRQMPGMRLFGNAVLSFFSKASSGYWSIFDPTNGYTAIHATALDALALDNISERYFFESDMLVNLGGVRAVVVDIPMEAVYGDEVSHLKIRQVLFEFLGKHLRGLVKRVLYSYFLRNFSLASVNLVFGLLLFGFGTIFGAIEWYSASQAGELTSTGTVMIAVLPIILGFQLILSFLNYDIENEPDIPLQSLKQPAKKD